MDQIALIHHSFLNQAKWCEELESPFTAELLREIATDFNNRGIVFKLCGAWPTNPISDALGLRICGGLNYFAITNRNPRLKSEWPPICVNWDINRAWQIAKLAIGENFDWFEKFIESPPQTNEVRRSAAIFAGACVAINGFDGPIDVLELGASAGLNQSFDKFEYSLGGFRSRAKSSVKIDSDWRGADCPDLTDIQIRNRASCDQSPLDVFDKENELLLQAYIWPDQKARQERTIAAIDIAKKNSIKVDKEDASVWIKERLFKRANDAMTIIFHSVFFNYPPNEVRQSIHDTIHAEIMNSQPNAPLVWLRFENYGSLIENTNSNQFTNQFVLDLVAKDFAASRTEHKILAKLDPHCRWIEWL